MAQPSATRDRRAGLKPNSAPEGRRHLENRGVHRVDGRSEAHAQCPVTILVPSTEDGYPKRSRAALALSRSAISSPALFKFIAWPLRRNVLEALAAIEPDRFHVAPLRSRSVQPTRDVVAIPLFSMVISSSWSSLPTGFGSRLLITIPLESVGDGAAGFLIMKGGRVVPPKPTV